MATTGVGFRWLDLLEKEFDKACVELDTSLVELETEEPEVVFSARQKITTLSSCFAQLTHKALTIFQSSAKLEAELVDMRAELVQARAAGGCQDGGDAAGNVPEAARARAEAAQLARENVALRETVLALHSELFGARLATKYLDKELAGRIQQLQLLGSDMRAELRDSLWAQVEAEILLQRHKTLVRVCRGLAPRAPRPPQPARAPPAPRTVRVRRSPHLGLGISVTGGREHGVPILISELEAGGPAALTGELYVGDAILAINDHDLTQACHKEAVQALQSVKGDCALCVQFIATDDDDRLSEDNYRFPLYPEDGDAYEEEPDASGATPTAPRTPDYNHHASGSECGDDDPYGVRGEVGEYDNRGDSGVYGARGEAGTYGVRSQEGTYGLRNEIGAYGAYHVRGEEEYIRNEGVEVAGSHYADYNNINNLSILDMDDDSIKIEARLEMAPISAVSGSSTSPRSTPVHSRATLKKKRKPQDWRTKGAYCAVSDAQSSDDLHEKSNTPNLRPDLSNLRSDPSNQRPDPSNQRPDPSNQRSDPANQRPDPSNQRPDTSNERPHSSNQRPDPSNQRPDPSSQRPDPSSQRPDPSNQRSDPSIQRPDLSNHQIDLLNHQPDPFNHRPDLPNHWPDSLNHRNELVNHRPESESIGTPSKDVCLPAISEYLPKPPSMQDDSRAVNTSTTAVTDVVMCNTTASTPGATSVAASTLTSAVTSKPMPAPDLQSSREKAPSLDVHYTTNKTNGDHRPRKETKSFRIGSARRVMDSARNGEVGRHPPHPPHAAHAPPAPRLLPGRGDPDFGTPV